MLKALAMLACTTPGCTTWPSSETGAEPAFAAWATARCSFGVAVVATATASAGPPPELWDAAASCAWRISAAQSVYSSASALSSFSARLYARGLNPASDWPCVQRWMIVSPTSADAAGASAQCGGRQQRDEQGGPMSDRSALVGGDSHTWTAQR